MNRYRVNRKFSQASALTLGLLSLCMLCYTNPKTTSEHSSNDTVNIATKSPYAGVSYYTFQLLNSSSEPDAQESDVTTTSTSEDEAEFSEEESSESTITTNEEEIPQEDEQETSQDNTSDTSNISEEIYLETTDEYTGNQLNSVNGRVNGPSGSETYYNLNMSNCVHRMQDLGYDYEYWVREDGAKMLGPYIMVAADFSTRPLGTVLETSLGTAIVVDTGDFIEDNPTGIDIAVTW